MNVQGGGPDLLSVLFKPALDRQALATEEKRLKMEADTQVRTSKEIAEHSMELAKKMEENRIAVMAKYDKERAGDRRRYMAAMMSHKAAVAGISGSATMAILQNIAQQRDQATGALMTLDADLKRDNKRVGNSASRMVGSLGASNFAMEELLREWSTGTQQTTRRMDGILDQAEMLSLPPDPAPLEIIDPSSPPDPAPQMYKRGETMEVRGILSEEVLRLLPAYAKNESVRSWVQYFVSGDGGETSHRDDKVLYEKFSKIPGEMIQDLRTVFHVLGETADLRAEIVMDNDGVSNERLQAIADQIFPDDAEEGKSVLGDLLQFRDAASSIPGEKRRVVAKKLNMMARQLRELGAAVNVPVDQDISEKIHQILAVSGAAESVKDNEALAIKSIGMGIAASWAEAAATYRTLGMPVEEITDIVNTFTNKQGLPAEYANQLILHAASVARAVDPEGEASPLAAKLRTLDVSYDVSKSLAEAVKAVDLPAVLVDENGINVKAHQEIGIRALSSDDPSFRRAYLDSLYDAKTGTVYNLSMGGTEEAPQVIRGDPMFVPGSKNNLYGASIRALMEGNSDESVLGGVRAIFDSQAEKTATTLSVLRHGKQTEPKDQANSLVVPGRYSPLSEEIDGMYEDEYVSRVTIPTSGSYGYASTDAWPGSAERQRYEKDQFTAKLEEMKSVTPTAPPIMTNPLAGPGIPESPQRGDRPTPKLNPTARSPQGMAQGAPKIAQGPAGPPQFPRV